jgi:hypothetical protein
MAVKLTSRQQAQCAYLAMLPPKFQRIHAVIEAMTALRADEAVVRGLARLLDEIKGNAAGLSLTGLADTAGLMATMTRRGGGLQMKVRGLRELLGSLKINYEAALRSATTPESSSSDQDCSPPYREAAPPRLARTASMIGPHISAIIALTSTPIRADTKVRAPRIKLAPMVARSTPIQYIVRLRRKAEGWRRRLA